MVINRILTFALSLLVFLHVCNYSINAYAEGLNFSFFKKFLGNSQSFNLMGGKTFKLECKKSNVKRLKDFYVMYLEEKEVVGCKLIVERKIVDKANGEVKIEAALKAGEKVSVRVTPGSGMTNENGEFNVRITGGEKGIDWIGWSIADKKGKFNFSKEAYDSGTAWGLYVVVR